MEERLELRPLDRAGLEPLHREHLSADFPRREVKALSLLLRLYDEGRVRMFGSYGPEETLDAYALLQFPPRGGIWLLDYLAVRRGLRGHGLGSRFLASLRPELSGAEALILEIERVDRSIDRTVKLVRGMRKRFYLERGFSETGVFARDNGGTEYEILCLPLSRTPDAGEVRQAILMYYEDFFPGGDFDAVLGA